MKRKHHDAIVAWAGGAKIEFRNPIGSNVWIDSENPAWLDDYEYRVKPAREYPATRMTCEELVEVVRSASGGFSESYVSLVNAGLRHAIDAGQVVTREEFDALAASVKADRKARDFAIAESVRDKAYVAVMNCDNSLEGVVVRTLDIAAIIAEVK